MVSDHSSLHPWELETSVPLLSFQAHAAIARSVSSMVCSVSRVFPGAVAHTIVIAIDGGLPLVFEGDVDFFEPLVEDEGSVLPSVS